MSASDVHGKGAPSAPPLSLMDVIPGYESTGTFDDLPPPQPGFGVPGQNPNPPVPHWNIPSISEDVAKEVFIDYASSKCCYGTRPAKELVFTDLQPYNTFRYRLETFTESRSTEWAYEPYRVSRMVRAPKMTTGKRKLKTLSIAEQVTVIRAVEKGDKKTVEIAEQFGIPTSTLSTFLKEKEKILKLYSEKSCGHQKRMRECEYPVIEQYILKWFVQARDRNVPINGKLLQKLDVFRSSDEIEEIDERDASAHRCQAKNVTLAMEGEKSDAVTAVDGERYAVHRALAQDTVKGNDAHGAMELDAEDALGVVEVDIKPVKKNQIYEHVPNRCPDFPIKLFEKVNGDKFFVDENIFVYPIVGFPDEEICEASKKGNQEHLAKFSKMRILQQVDQDLVLSFYHSVIQSVITYNFIAWFGVVMNQKLKNPPHISKHATQVIG
ncbi:SSUH2 protein, partial [Polypterus senegalus]